VSLTANFLTELQNKTFRGNLVISIDGTYFSQYQPESGLVVDTDKLGLVDTVKINGVTLDIRKANTPIATIGFRLLDKNAVLSSFIGTSSNSLQNAEVKLYFGFMTGSFDFNDYVLLGVTRINSVSKKPNYYDFTSKEVTDLVQAPLININDVLDGVITDVQTTIDLIDASNFPNSGSVKIGSEFMQYSGKTLNQLTGVARGDLTSTPSLHDDGDTVSLVTKKEAKSMDIALDVILNDLSIDPALVDQDSFTDLRDNDFNGEDDYTLQVYDVSNALKWLEERILEATNTRLFSVNGKITIGLLDQVPKFDNLPEIDESHIEGNPSWKISSDKIVNRIVIKWGWNEGTQKFTKTSTFTDDDSITIFGERKTLTVKLYGVYTQSIVNNRANRLLNRFSTPKAQVKVKTHFNRFFINIADNTRLTHRFLPQEGGTLGFSDTLEVMSKGVAGLHVGASINFGLEFSSYSGIRIGLIAPSPKLDLTITDQKTFLVPDGSCYGVGYRCILFDNINNVYLGDPINTVAEINGNELTFTDDFVTPLGSNISLYFTDYDNANGDQRAKYAFTAPNTGVFDVDNSKAYQIIF